MKKEIRVLGIDDMPFSFNEETVDIVGVVMRGGVYLEGVLKATITVDGDDATENIISMVEGTRHRKQLKVIMIDGAALGGFNIVDCSLVHARTKIPVITVTRNKPDMARIREALRKHFSDWKWRWGILKSTSMEQIMLRYPVYAASWGFTTEEMKDIIKLSIVRGAIPEPLRVAHLIATGMKTGESHGRC